MRACILAIGLASVLAGCAAFGVDRSTPEGRCEAAAYDDPEVKRLIIANNSGNSADTVYLLAAQRDAVNRAKLRCLQKEGLAPRGGVEPVRRYN